MDFPQLSSLVPTQVTQYLQRLASAITGVEQSVTQLKRSGYISGKEVQGFVDPTQIAAALQAGGKAPLNVGNLVGKLAQPQLAGCPQVTALPAFNSPLSQDGALVRFNGLLYFFDQSVDPGTWKPVGSIGALLEGTHAQRISATYTPPSLYPEGTLFWEVDRQLLYFTRAGNWTYLTGTYSRAYAQIAAVEAGLTNNDTGLLIFVNDYDHVIKWNGTTAKWVWAPGDSQGGYVQHHIVDPDTSNGGYNLCDGSATTYLLITAGVLSIPGLTMPNLFSNPAFPKLGPSYTGPGNTAGVAATVASSGVVASEGLGPVTDAFTLDAAGAFAVTGFADPHSHGFTDPVYNGDGEPVSISFRAWFRR